jgi:transcriptional regulator with XRE-family HTH domain
MATATQNGKAADHLPLAVMLFHSAMERNIGMAKLAEELGLSPLSLRQFVEGNTQRPRSKTIELLAGALNISVDEARRRVGLAPEKGPNFSSWLQDQMQGRFSRARLTKETKISDGALRNYIAGQTLPDSDQARKLADALGVPTIEVARIIIAHHTAQAGGVTVAPGTHAEAASRTEAEESSPNGVEPTESATVTPTTLTALPAAQPASEAASTTSSGAPNNREEGQLLNLWRQLHPQARRATLIYIAGLLAES